MQTALLQRALDQCERMDLSTLSASELVQLSNKAFGISARIELELEARGASPGCVPDWPESNLLKG